MKEIEVKILDVDRAAVEKKLLTMGAEKVFDGEMIAEYFDSPDGTIRNENQTLRLRKAGDETRLTFKAPVDHKTAAKVKEEHEVVVDDFSTMKTILERLGFVAWRPIQKNRTSYVLGDIRFEFDLHKDKFAWIPEFLEIEGPDEATVFRVAEQLGFSKEECHGCGVDYLHKYYGKKLDY